MRTSIRPSGRRDVSKVSAWCGPTPRVLRGRRPTRTAIRRQAPTHGSAARSTPAPPHRHATTAACASASGGVCAGGDPSPARELVPRFGARTLGCDEARSRPLKAAVTFRAPRRNACANSSAPSRNRSSPRLTSRASGPASADSLSPRRSPWSASEDAPMCWLHGCQNPGARPVTFANLTEQSTDRCVRGACGQTRRWPALSAWIAVVTCRRKLSTKCLTSL